LKIGLRSKVVLVALVLAVIPFSGYLYLREMEALLREGQEQALAATARAIAMALHDRPQLADLSAGRPVSGEMALILKSLARAESRIWIVDQDHRLLALVGDLKKRAPASGKLAPPASAPLELAVKLVRPLTDHLLERPSEDFDDSLSDAEMAEGSVAASALQGVPARRSRLTSDGRAVILSAAYPVWSGENVAAAVVAEETTNAARSVYGRALDQVVAVTLIALLAGALTLLVFASRLSVRLRRLRDEAEAAIDSQGRVRGLLAGSTSGDEIGDLSRSFSTVLERLAQYNAYLEAMGGRLSHELRTPIAVVRSSLDNLKLQGLPQDAAVYLERAGDGLRRLDTILRRMSEATRAARAPARAGTIRRAPRGERLRARLPREDDRDRDPRRAGLAVGLAGSLRADARQARRQRGRLLRGGRADPRAPVGEGRPRGAHRQQPRAAPARGDGGQALRVDGLAARREERRGAAPRARPLHRAPRRRVPRRRRHGARPRGRLGRGGARHLAARGLKSGSEPDFSGRIGFRSSCPRPAP
jgi:hypothetical protein